MQMADPEQTLAVWCEKTQMNEQELNERTNELKLCAVCNMVKSVRVYVFYMR